MGKWVWPATAGVVTSGTGVAINLATDGGGNPWAWVAVVLLTALGVVVALRVQPATPEVTPAITAAAEPEPEPKVAPKPEPVAAPKPEPEPVAEQAPRTRPNSVHNVYNGGSGTVGAVVQIGYVDKVNSPTTVNQSAVAHEGGTVHQAGRDINPNP